MKIQSKTKVVIANDRQGKEEEFIQIKIKQAGRDSEAKEYTFETKDFLVLNKGTENESFQVNKDRNGNECVYRYVKTFAKFKQQKAALKALYPTSLTGDDLDDYLLRLVLLDDVTNAGCYGVEFEKL